MCFHMFFVFSLILADYSYVCFYHSLFSAHPHVSIFTAMNILILHLYYLLIIHLFCTYITLTITLISMFAVFLCSCSQIFHRVPLDEALPQAQPHTTLWAHCGDPSAHTGCLPATVHAPELCMLLLLAWYCRSGGHVVAGYILCLQNTVWPECCSSTLSVDRGDGAIPF